MKFNANSRGRIVAFEFSASRRKNKDEKLATDGSGKILRKTRQLGEDGSSSIFLDQNGDEYETCSLAWRYIGMYRDCSAVDYEGSCKNVLLWAAYVDKRYNGGGIGEYQFWDFESNRWDKSSCQQGKRCAKMNCHQASSKHFKLIGVFKDSYGMKLWAEQLYKHEGYCLWEEEKYEFMQDQQYSLPHSCQYYVNALDADGVYHTFYTMLKPLPFGNYTIGLYEDEACSVESYFEVEDCIYAKSNGDDSAVEEYETTIEILNMNMNIFKICQPCRAYNLNSNEQRRLNSNDNADESDEDEWDYNCYDDAGCTNCNQCYKFESQTNLEVAEKDDLKEASEQGTILAISVNGIKYGHGRFPPPTGIAAISVSKEDIYLTISLLLLFGSGFLLAHQLHQIIIGKRKRRRNRKMPAAFEENFISKDRNTKFDDNITELYESESESESDDHNSSDRSDDESYIFPCGGVSNDDENLQKNYDRKVNDKEKGIENIKSWSEKILDDENISRNSKSLSEKVFEASEIVLRPLADTRLAEQYGDFLVRRGFIVEEGNDDDDDDDDDEGQNKEACSLSSSSTDTSPSKEVIPP